MSTVYKPCFMDYFSLVINQPIIPFLFKFSLRLCLQLSTIHKSHTIFNQYRVTTKQEIKFPDNSLSFPWKIWKFSDMLHCNIWPFRHFSPRPDGLVVSMSDSCPGGCEFDPLLRRLFFPAHFRLSPLQKHTCEKSSWWLWKEKFY